MFTLETFGGLSLRDADGPVTTRVGQRRRLALLAILAAERRPVSRDKLLGLLWPESDADRGRHLLADSLYVMRSGLGDDAVETVGDDVTLNEQLVTSDVASFLQAVGAGAFEEAVAAYSGPFLDGVFISDAPEFERWTQSTRDRLENERRRCLERLATEAGERGDRAQAVEWWRALAGADRLSSRPAIGLIRALVAAGDRIAALQFARVHEEIVRAELDSAPDSEVTALVNEVRLAPVDPPASPSGPASRTARGERTSSPHSPEEPSTSRDASPRLTPSTMTRRRIGLVAFVAAMAAAVVAIASERRGDAQSTSTRDNAMGIRAASIDFDTIAVLPFDPIGPDSEATYVANGITQALVTKLQQQRLPVMSTQSASVAKRSQAAPAVIAESLHVRYLVEGSVRLEQGQMRIDVGLIDAPRGSRIQSVEFRSVYSPKSVMDIEGKIADSIATALHVPLAHGSVSDLGRSTRNEKAFEANNTGAWLLAFRNPDRVKASITYFKRAIHEDTSFALPYVGLADAYASLAVGNTFDNRPDEDFPRSRDAAQRALELNATLAEAHASLGYFELLYQLNWDSASAELQRAIRIQPSYQNALVYRTILFEWRGQFADAVNEAQHAYALDRVSPLVNVELGRALFFAGAFDSARRTLEHALVFDSGSVRAHLHLGQVLVHQGKYDDGVREITTAAKLSPNSSRALALLSHAYVAAGRRKDAELVLDSLQRRARSRYVPAFDFAIVHAGLGHTTETFQWLDSSIADHSIRPYLLDPTFDGIRRDQRYTALLARIGLTPIATR